MKVWLVLSLLGSACLIKLFGDVGAFLVLFIFMTWTIYTNYRNNFRPKI